jgi:hypothetical protein
VIDVHNYNYPIPRKLYQYDEVLYPKTKVKNFVGFKPHKLYSDDGFIFSNNNTNNGENYTDNEYISIADESQNMVAYPLWCDTNDIEDPTDDFYCNRLFRLQFYTYRQIITYTRVYQRISDALAKVGGLASILMRAFIILMDIYCTFIRNERIANYIYDFDIEQEKKILKDRKNSILKINDNINNFKNNFIIKIDEEVKMKSVSTERKISNFNNELMKNPEQTHSPVDITDSDLTINHFNVKNEQKIEKKSKFRFKKSLENNKTIKVSQEKILIRSIPIYN